MPYSHLPAPPDLVDLLVDRLFERLATALSASGQPAAETLTIGDLYLRLVPYRAVRGELGILELAEYEHALLRLLGGQGGYLEIADESVSEEIQRELASVNPILGIYRDYPSAEVRVRGQLAARTDAGEDAEVQTAHPVPGDKSRAERVPHTREVTELPGSGPPEPFAESGERTQQGGGQPAPADVPATDASARESSPETRPGPAAASHSPHGGATPVSSKSARESDPGVPSPIQLCEACRRPLPDVSDLRFCPFCGSAQGPKPCPECGTPLEGGWSFCIRCGSPGQS